MFFTIWFYFVDFYVSIATIYMWNVSCWKGIFIKGQKNVSLNIKLVIINKNCFCVWEKHIKAINMCELCYKTLLLSQVSICFNTLDWILTCRSTVQFTIQILILVFDIGLRPDSICIVLQFSICFDPLDRYFDLLGSVQFLTLEFLYQNILTKLTLINWTN